MHWSDRYLSRSFRDCGHLIEVVLEEVFNIKYNFPETKKDGKLNSELIMDTIPTYLTYIPNDEKIKEGDVALMNIESVGCHVGMWVDFGGRNGKAIVHYMPHKGVYRHAPYMLKNMGMKVLASYTWKEVKNED